MFEPPQGRDYGLSDDFLCEMEVPLDAALGLTAIEQGCDTDSSKNKIDVFATWLDHCLRSPSLQQNRKFFVEVLRELRTEASACESVRAELEQIVRELRSIVVWGKGNMEGMHKLCHAFSRHFTEAIMFASKPRRLYPDDPHLRAELLSDQL